MDLQEFKDQFAKRLFGRTRSEAKEKGICVDCGKKIKGFKDELSSKEYEITGFCQECQDSVFEEDK